MTTIKKSNLVKLIKEVILKEEATAPYFKPTSLHNDFIEKTEKIGWHWKSYGDWGIATTERNILPCCILENNYMDVHICGYKVKRYDITESNLELVLNILKNKSTIDKNIKLYDYFFDSAKKLGFKENAIYPFKKFQWTWGIYGDAEIEILLEPNTIELGNNPTPMPINKENIDKAVEYLKSKVPKLKKANSTSNQKSNNKIQDIFVGLYDAPEDANEEEGDYWEDSPADYASEKYEATVEAEFDDSDKLWHINVDEEDFEAKTIDALIKNMKNYYKDYFDLVDIYKD